MTNKPKPSFAPAYCALYPALAELIRTHGYALSIHGSLQRDFDLVCIPWAEEVSDHSIVVKDITEKFAIRQIGEPEIKNHGRLAYTISVVFGECVIDLSFVNHVSIGSHEGSRNQQGCVTQGG